MKTILKLLTITINFLATLATPYHFTARRAPSPRNAKARRRLVFVLPLGDEPPGDDLPESLSNMVARWHGGVEDKFANIENLVTTLEANRSLWPVPNDIITWLDTNMTALNELMQKCRSRNATSNDRLKRNTLVNKMVYYSLDTVRNWVYGEYAIKVMTREDIHMLGFLLMGENSKSRRRGGEVFVLAEIKARVNDDRTVNLVIDQASDKNAALVEEGWPKGAH
jgi:hypothetical protein